MAPPLNHTLHPADDHSPPPTAHPSHSCCRTCAQMEAREANALSFRFVSKLSQVLGDQGLRFLDAPQHRRRRRALHAGRVVFGSLKAVGSDLSLTPLFGAYSGTIAGPKRHLISLVVVWCTVSTAQGSVGSAAKLRPTPKTAHRSTLMWPKTAITWCGVWTAQVVWVGTTHVGMARSSSIRRVLDRQLPPVWQLYRHERLQRPPHRDRQRRGGRGASAGVR